MKIVDDDYGHIRVTPVKPLEKGAGGIILPFEKKGMRGGKIGRIESGKDKGKYALYKANMEIKIDVFNTTWMFLDEHAIICIMEAEEGEEFVEAIAVDAEYGKPGWIGPGVK